MCNHDFISLYCLYFLNSYTLYHFQNRNILHLTLIVFKFHLSEVISTHGITGYGITQFMNIYFINLKILVDLL